MTERELELELMGYWQITSGRGASAVADAVIVRDADGLPVIPGRTLKGLLRAATRRAAALGHLEASDVEQLFGTDTVERGGLVDDRAERRLEESRFATDPGLLSIGSARLPAAWRQWARTNPTAPELQELSTFIASTAIDADGLASASTLRVAEVAVPMTLRAVVSGPPDNAWQRTLTIALPLLRSLGAQRNRGLGRVTARWSTEATQ